MHWLLRKTALLLPVALYLAYFLHLDSDMPDPTRWNDFARFTDEGWYSSAALHWTMDGRWYQPHSFNAAAALPAWPALLSIVFSVFGPSMIAARSTALVFVGIALLTMYRTLKPYCGAGIASGSAVLLLLNPYAYNFLRMAMLESPVSCLMMLGTALALRVGRLRSSMSVSIAGTAMGLLMCLSVLMKTTAIVLVPVILTTVWLHSEKSGARAKHAFTFMAIALLTGLLVWTLWFSSFVAPHHFADFKHFFRVNAEPAHSLKGLIIAEAKAVYDMFWLGRIFFPLVLISLALSCSIVRSLWRESLFTSFVLQLSIYVGFLGWHANRQQRYEVICLIPSVGVLAMTVVALRQRKDLRVIYTGFLAALLVAAFSFARTTLAEMLHPAFTWRDSSLAIAQIIRADKRHSQVLLAGPGDDVSLFTMVQSSNPRWPPDGMRPLLEGSRPGWYLAPIPTDDDTIKTLASFYKLRKVASFVTMPSSSHQKQVLYRLDPLDGVN